MFVPSLVSTINSPGKSLFTGFDTGFRKEVLRSCSCVSNGMPGENFTAIRSVYGCKGIFSEP